MFDVVAFDYADRMRHAGFSVKVIPSTSFISREQLQRMGITNPLRYVFYLQKTEINSRHIQISFFRPLFSLNLF